MHTVIHRASDLGLGIILAALLVMIVLNWLIARQLPLYVRELYYLERQRYARRGVFGPHVQREAHWANVALIVGTVLLWPDIIYHVWYLIGKLF